MAYWRRRKKTAKQTSGRRLLRAEQLEPRCLLSAVVMSDWEQLLIELVNRARADPEAEAIRHGTPLNEGLSPGTISAAPKQPLAPNRMLLDAAGDHSQDMLDRDFFSHTNPDGQSPFDRMREAGYVYTTAGENLSWTGTTGTLDRDGAIFAHHEGLFESPSHRVNFLGPSFREIGTGIRHGIFTSGSDFNASMATEKFGARSGNPFVTGVVYEDRVVDDDFYTLGEGLSDVTITAAEVSSGAEYVTQSGPSGGYALRVPAGTYTVTASGGELEQTMTSRNVVIAAENRKVDFDASESPETVVWQNPDEPLDVNGNGKIEPLDALIIINYLNRSSSGPLPVPSDAPPPYLDVRGIGSVAPLDALLIINHINQRSVGSNTATAGEGEFGADAPAHGGSERRGSELKQRHSEHERLRRQPTLATDSASLGSKRSLKNSFTPHFASAHLHGHSEITDNAARPSMHLGSLETTLSDIAEDVLAVWNT